MKSAAGSAPAGAGAMGAGDGARDHLVLVLAPTGRDMQLTCDLLTQRAGIACEPSPDIGTLCANILRGAGGVIIAEEALDVPGARRLLDALSGQLPWSDLPVLVLSNDDNEENARVIAALRQRGNVTVLDRPVRIVTLISAVQSALRARRRQYEVRDLLAETRTAVRQRDQFLAMLGHELRNPLGAINNALSVLDAASPPADPLEGEQRGIIQRQTTHLARLVDDLLDVSRITTGKVVLQRRTVDLCELAKRAAQSVDGPVRAQRHEFVVHVGCDPVLIDADPVRLEQVINNLLTNAIKYTAPSGRIELDVRREDDKAVLSVKDNGMGIPSDLLPRVFDLFTQAERALDRAQGGLGIGLTLVRSLIEMHEGNVVARSSGIGQGSEFLITLPALPVPAPATAPAASSPAAVEVRAAKSPSANVGAPAMAHANGNAHADGHGRRVLIIEDQPDARRALQRLLQIWGHEVEVAEAGPRGVEAAARVRPEVAFVDVGLPGLDGYEVARRIRAQFGKDIRLIALTGYGQPEDRDRALHAGFDLHLVKPVDRDQLAKSVGDPAATASHRRGERARA